MSMFTRCPHCDTVFRVTPQQLQVSSGQVRCGRCEQVFDAFSTLSSRLPNGPQGEGDAAQPPTPARPAAATAQAPEGPVDYAFEAELSAERGAAPSATPVRASAAKADVAVDRPARESVESEALTLPDEIFKAGAASRRRWPWALASMLALAALAAQAAWLFPTEIGLRFPGLRPSLLWYCNQLQCKLELPRFPDQLFIEASDLQLLDPAHPSEVLLTATIRNRAAVEQALPLLELTLTDGANRTLARKVFTPTDYLGADNPRREGIGSNQEVSVRLYLDTGDIQPVGYRLYLFFA